MRTYAQFRPTFWTRGSGKKLRGKRDAQVLAIYLMTGPPSSMTGLYYQPMVAILHDLGMTEEAFRAALKDISEIALYDFDEELVWLPNGCREQMNLKEGARIKPADKRLPGVRTEVEAFGNHPFAVEFKRRYLPDPEPDEKGDTKGDTKGDREGHSSKGLGEGHAPSLHGTCSVLDPVPVPDLISQKTDPPDRSTPRTGEQPPRRGPLERNLEPASELPEVQAVWDDYREILELPNAALDRGRAESIYERVRTGVTREQFRTIWRNAKCSEWLRKRRFPVQLMLDKQDQFEALLHGSEGDPAGGTSKPTGIAAVAQLRRERGG